MSMKKFLFIYIMVILPSVTAIAPFRKMKYMRCYKKTNDAILGRLQKRIENGPTILRDASRCSVCAFRRSHLESSCVVIFWCQCQKGSNDFYYDHVKFDSLSNSDSSAKCPSNPQLNQTSTCTGNPWDVVPFMEAFLDYTAPHDTNADVKHCNFDATQTKGQCLISFWCKCNADNGPIGSYFFGELSTAKLLKGGLRDIPKCSPDKKLTQTSTCVEKLSNPGLILQKLHYHIGDGKAVDKSRCNVVATEEGGECIVTYWCNCGGKNLETSLYYGKKPVSSFNTQDSDVKCYTKTDPCQDNKCQHGECIRSENFNTYTCKCDENKDVYGKYCIPDPCRNTKCLNNSVCKPTEDNNDFVCKCDLKQPFIGKYCDVKSPCAKHDCQNDSDCVPSEDLTDYTCKCKNTVTQLGRYCRTNPCEDNLCVNGVCVAKDDYSRYECDCPNGDFIGKFCLDDPCKNNKCEYGSCVVNQNDFESYKCKCSENVGGEFCNKNPCYNKCSNGICTATNDFESYTCNCKENYKLDGENCVPVPETTKSENQGNSDKFRKSRQRKFTESTKQLKKWSFASNLLARIL